MFTECIPAESEAESEVDIPGLPKDGDEAEDGSCEEKEDEGEEEEEEDDLPKTPLPSRSSSRTPKPRQLDLPDLSPTRKRKRSSTSTRRQYPSSRSSVGDDTVSEEGLVSWVKKWEGVTDFGWGWCGASYGALFSLTVL
eukprot:sb/3474399/